MSDLLIIFCVAVLPWILWGALRWIKRDHPRDEPDTIEEVGKGVRDSLLSSIFPWFGK